MTGMDAAAMLASLERWEDFGGVWRVIALNDTTATVSLCRCDGGEEVERLVTRDPAALAYLADRRSGGAWE